MVPDVEASLERLLNRYRARSVVWASDEVQLPDGQPSTPAAHHAVRPAIVRAAVMHDGDFVSVFESTGRCLPGHGGEPLAGPACVAGYADGLVQRQRFRKHRARPTRIPACGQHRGVPLARP